MRRLDQLEVATFGVGICALDRTVLEPRAAGLIACATGSEGVSVVLLRPHIVDGARCRAGGECDEHRQSDAGDRRTDQSGLRSLVYSNAAAVTESVSVDAFVITTSALGRAAFDGEGLNRSPDIGRPYEAAVWSWGSATFSNPSSRRKDEGNGAREEPLLVAVAWPAAPFREEPGLEPAE